MKCIIADDERWVRYSIQDMLEEIAEAGPAWFDEISQAENGKDLLQQLESLQPELVFVDIRMPQVNGLVAIERGRFISPQTQWIILSGYAEFEYAKRAVALGALDYLLKPASRDDIERVVSLVLSQVADRRTQAQLALEHRMLGLLQDTFSEDPSLPSGTLFSGLVLTLDSALSLEQSNLLHAHTLKQLRRLLRTAPTLGSTGGVALLDDGNLMCVLSASRADILESDCLTLINLLSSMPLASGPSPGCQDGDSNRGFPASLTILPLGKNVSSLTELVRELVILSKDASLRLPGGIGQVLDSTRRRSLEARYGGEQSLFSSLDRVMRNRDLEPEALMLLLKQHRQELEKHWNDSRLDLYFEQNTELRCTGCDGRAAFDQYLQWGYSRLLPDAVSSEPVKRRRLVQKAVEILSEKFTEEIGLAQVADLMGITPNYLSTEFNRVMGESFSQYVTQLRMKKADELIRLGGLTVKEVAAQVGYVSSRHFTCLFKKHFGHVPSEHPA